MEIVQRVLEIAKSQVQVKEEPYGSNSGPQVDQYLKSVGLGPGAPWCAAFVNYCIQRASRDLNLSWTPWIATGDCWLIDTWGSGKHILHQHPEPGDVFLVGHSPEPFHTGIVSRVESDSFHSVEGNTNPGGGSEGYGVFERERSIASCYYVNWPSLVHEATYCLISQGHTIAEMPRRYGRALCPVRKLAEHLHLPAEWDEGTQSVHFNGQLLPEITFIDGSAYAPIRALAKLAGIDLSVQGKNVEMHVH